MSTLFFWLGLNAPWDDNGDDDGNEDEEEGDDDNDDDDDDDNNALEEQYDVDDVRTIADDLSEMSANVCFGDNEAVDNSSPLSPFPVDKRCFFSMPLLIL